MSATCKVLSAILSYPTAELQAAGRELIFALNEEQLLTVKHRAAVGALIADMAAADLLEAQSRYVDLFDRTRSLSLHFFEHVHGESRDRGQAMVSLLERYQKAGLDVAGRELPDYIPLFLEFLSTLSGGEARASLAEPAHILAALGERLRKRGSDYASVFDAMVALSHSVPSDEVLESVRNEKVEDPRDLAALDRTWEEAEVRFGPGDAAADGCPRANDILQRMNVPAAKPASRSSSGART
ncbi:MAG: nitrate reductase molybdenum cofactor assembly chaperone [Alphaproteobacteria bacterium 64-11]|nr:nitrate reductase molybdenum cofactor assembly chaperone [Alphaproteobacteria bacterium]OJU12070.1 MAG: nitrate reductase molybdenum cofactor assembly chaperone [Alphaproteobacteria bacterium 64-11]